MPHRLLDGCAVWMFVMNLIVLFANIIIDVSLVRRLDGPDSIQLLGYSNCVVCLVSCLDHYFVVSYCVL